MSYRGSFFSHLWIHRFSIWRNEHELQFTYQVFLPQLFQRGHPVGETQPKLCSDSRIQCISDAICNIFSIQASFFSISQADFMETCIINAILCVFCSNIRCLKSTGAEDISHDASAVFCRQPRDESVSFLHRSEQINSWL